MKQIQNYWNQKKLLIAINEAFNYTLELKNFNTFGEKFNLSKINNKIAQLLANIIKKGDEILPPGVFQSYRERKKHNLNTVQFILDIFVQKLQVKNIKELKKIANMFKLIKEGYFANKDLANAEVNTKSHNHDLVTADEKLLTRCKLIIAAIQDAQNNGGGNVGPNSKNKTSSTGGAGGGRGNSGNNSSSFGGAGKQQ